MAWLFWFPSAAALTFDEALQRAAAGSEDVLVAQAAVERAAGDQVEARSGYLPTVSGAVNYQHTFKSEYEALSDAFGGADLPFGQAETWRVDLSASQPIWTGGRTAATMRLAKAGGEVAGDQLVSTRAAAVLRVAEAYMDAALADRLHAIALATLAQAEVTLRDAQLAHEVGRQPEFEVLRARVQVENQRVLALQQQRIARLARAELARLLDLPESEIPAELEPVQALSSDLPERAARYAGVTPGPVDGPRLAITNAERGVGLAEASRSLVRSQFYPQVYASAAYGWVAYPDNPVPFVPFDEWAVNFTAGLGVSVPIFGGLKVHGQMDAAAADLAEAQARLDQAREYARLEALDTTITLQTSVAQAEAARLTIEQAQKAYAIAETRFREGISSQVELTDARLLLDQALVNEARAVRDVQVARIRAALLPALPLAGAPS